MISHHLAIFKKPYLDLILSGQKTIESRFSKYNRPPFDCVRPGDQIFLKLASGPVIAKVPVSKVMYFKDLCPAKIEQIKIKYNSRIQGTLQYWQSKSSSRFGTLIWLGRPEPIEPVFITKKDMRAWVVLKPGDDFSLLRLTSKSISKQD